MPATSFAKDISPLIREFDVTSMKTKGLDLSNYEQVKKLADKIYGVLSAGKMPCDGPWPAEKLQKFKAWMDGGMQP